MKTHTFSIGTTGELKIVDNSSEPELMTVEFWVRSSSPISVPQFAWAFALDGGEKYWKSKNVLAITDWQFLGFTYVGGASQVTITTSATGTPELGEDLGYEYTVDLYTVSIPGNPYELKTVLVRIDGEYKQVVPYIRNNGVWAPCEVWTKRPSGWVRHD